MDYQFASLLYMNIAARSWIYIVSGFLTDAHKDNQHWCIDFLRLAKQEAIKELKENKDPSLLFAIN